jgi:CTP synthase (UTP-ammonia lyase)
LSEWDSVVDKLYSPEAAVDIAMVGKYMIYNQYLSPLKLFSSIVKWALFEI